VKTSTMPTHDTLPKEINRTLTAISLGDDFRDDRTRLARLFGDSRFSWQTGWLSAGGVQHAYVRISGWPPGLLTKACTHLGSRFIVVRTEMGLLDKRRHHPFVIVLISGRRDAGA
jgi:hypothetical protein